MRSEWLKLRTTRVPVMALALVPAMSAVVAYASLSLAGKDGNAPLGPASFVDALSAPASIVTTVMLVLGVLATTTEYRYQTVTTTFLAAPRRWPVVAAKLGCAAIAGAAAAATSLAVTTAIAIPWLRSEGIAVEFGGDGLRIAAGVLASAALFAAVGVAVGAIVRNQTAAVAIVFVWLLAVEGLVTDVWGADVFRWLPAAAGGALVRHDAGADHLTFWPALAVVAGYAAALAAWGTALVSRRDVA